MGLATAGLGWYYDLGVQYLRMIFSGVFDRHPGLQVIAGHWGELVLCYLDHTGILAHNAYLQRPLLDYFKQISGPPAAAPSANVTCQVCLARQTHRVPKLRNGCS